MSVSERKDTLNIYFATTNKEFSGYFIKLSHQNFTT